MWGLHAETDTKLSRHPQRWVCRVRVITGGVTPPLPPRELRDPSTAERSRVMRLCYNPSTAKLSHANSKYFDLKNAHAFRNGLNEAGGQRDRDNDRLEG